MRETVKTLRVYFGFSAVYAIFSGARDFSHADIVGGIVGLVFGVAYLYLSIRLPKLLKDSPGPINWVLIAASIYLGIACLAGLGLRNWSLAVICAIGLAINWYLLRNAKRLAAELQSPIIIEQIPSNSVNG